MGGNVSERRPVFKCIGINKNLLIFKVQAFGEGAHCCSSDFGGSPFSFQPRAL
jgi:hypothetical protein